MANQRFRLTSASARRFCLGYISNLPIDESHPITIKVEEGGRTLAQNALLWPLLDCFATQVKWPVNGQMVSMSREDWKDVLSAAFKRETQRVAMGLDGGVVVLGIRTSRMHKEEFRQFVDYLHAVGKIRGVNFEHAYGEAA